MRNLSLCIDIDGTITEPHYWLPRANAHFGTSLQSQDITRYEPYENLQVPKQTYQQFYDRYGHLMHLESTIRPDAQAVISELFTHHAVHVVTARDERMRSVSCSWLTGHQVPMHSITLLGHPNKVQTAIDLHADFFLEDSHDNAVQLAQADFHVLLVDCSYNRAPLPPNVTRVHDWLEIREIITQYAQQPLPVRAAN